MWTGAVRAGRVIDLVGQLGNEPRSRYRAAVMGAEYMGWGKTETVLANLFDRITALVEGDKFDPEHLHPRPSDDAEDEPATTVAEFNVDRFMRQLGQ